MVKTTKGRYSLRRTPLLAATAAALLVAGCGTKGSLFLPKVPTVPARAEAPRAATPAVATPRSSAGDDNKPASQDRPQ